VSLRNVCNVVLKVERAMVAIYYSLPYSLLPARLV
jgi:hypothetical protein